MATLIDNISLVQKASFWKRLISFAIDYIILTIILLIIIIGFSLHDKIVYWLNIQIYMVYNIVMDYFFQATFGKMILKLKVIQMNGAKPDFKTAFYRNIGKVISAIPFYYGFIRILAPHRLQTMHDEFGKCFVVEKKSTIE